MGDVLQNALFKAIEDKTTIPFLITAIIIRKLAGFGVTPSVDEITTLLESLEQQYSDVEAKQQTGLSGPYIPFGVLPCIDNLTSEQLQELGNITEKDLEGEEVIAEQALQQAIEYTTQKYSRVLVDEWHKVANEMLAKDRKMVSEFLNIHRKYWQKSLDLLEMLVSLSFDLASTFVERYRADTISSQDNIFVALTRIHARGCQVARAILVLLENGLADDALARWRTLHELAVVASFIAYHGDDVALQYLLHAHITDYKEMEVYERHHQKLGMPSVPQEEKDELNNLRDRLLKQFGEPFGSDYGWAAKALRVKRPTFENIEEKADFGSLRPFFKAASNNVHAGSKGIWSRLGDPPSRDVLLAGRSIYGLGEPMQNTAFALMSLTTTLLNHKTTVDSLATSEALLKLATDILHAVHEAESEIETADRKQG